MNVGRMAGRLPGHGHVYNEASLTEDHDLTLSLPASATGPLRLPDAWS